MCCGRAAIYIFRALQSPASCKCPSFALPAPRRRLASRDTGLELEALRVMENTEEQHGAGRLG